MINKILNIIVLYNLFPRISSILEQESTSISQSLHNERHEAESIQSSPLSRRLLPSNPEDVGLGHTSIIDNIEQRMALYPPKTKNQYLQTVGIAAAELLCDEEDESCQKRIMKLTIDMKVGPQGKASSGTHHLKINVLPKSFDPVVMKSLEKLFYTSSLADLKEDPLDVLRIMHKDYEELKNSDEVKNERDRIIGLVTYTVGMESTKQWHAIFTNPESPFVLLHNKLKPKKRIPRYLQFADLIGNVVGGVIDNSEAGDTVVGSTVSTLIGSNVPNVQGTIDADVNVTELLEADLIGASAGIITTGFGAAAGNLGGEQDGVLAGVLGGEQDEEQGEEEGEEQGGVLAGVLGGVLGGEQAEEQDEEQDEDNILIAVVEQASLASAKQVVNTFTPPEDEEPCLLPGIFCTASPDQSTLDLENPQGCKHPDSPYCNTTVPNPGDPIKPGGCIFDSSEFC